MAQQTIWVDRDLAFSIYLTDAGGAPYVIPGGAQYRFRLFSRTGTVLVDLPFGAGVAIGSASLGRIDIDAAAPLAGLTDTMGASAELTRTDTGMDVIGTPWPVRIASAGAVPFDSAAGITINVAAAKVSIAGQTGFGGPPGPAGAAGPSAFVASAVPYLYNGGFDLWGVGASGFGGVSDVIAEGWRFTRGAGSSHGLSRIAGLGPDTPYACFWNRTAAGTGDSTLALHIEDIRQFHNKTVTFAWEDNGGTVDYATRILRRFGTGGSAATAVTGAVFTAGGAVTVRSQSYNVGDISAATITDDTSLEFIFWRRISNADGVLRIAKVRMFVGSTDFGYVKPDPGLAAAAARRRLQRFVDRSVNGSKRVYFPPMRVAPSVTASIGTVSNIKDSSFDHSHSAVADVTFTLDAEL